MWNYVFYKAYLDFKDVNELNGNESYVYNEKDLSWLPINKAMCIRDEEEEINKKQQLID